MLSWHGVRVLAASCLRGGPKLVPHPAPRTATGWGPQETAENAMDPVRANPGESD